LSFGEGVDDRLHTWAFDHPDESREEIDAITSAGRLHHGPQPIALGAGERIFDGVGGLRFDIGPMRATEHVVHVTLRLPAR
jgi:hypothetical protein